MFACWRCQRNLDAYLDHELPSHIRRRVARHLDDCPRCYQAYIQRRELRHELQRTLPLVGRGDAPDFTALWGAIQAELPRPASSPRPYHMRFGLAALALMVMFLLPFTLRHHEASSSTPARHPVPVAAVTDTPESTEPVGVVATVVASITRESQLIPATSVPTMPEPGIQEIARGFDGNTN